MEGSTSGVRIISRRMVRRESTSLRNGMPPEPENTHLTPWDLRMITVDYIQNGQHAVEHLVSSFVRALARFYPLADCHTVAEINDGVSPPSLLASPSPTSPPRFTSHGWLVTNSTCETCLFRPICLIHSFAKLVSKLLATRLARFLNLLVEPNQSAFIKGRSIQDSSDMCKDQSSSVIRKKARILLKLDLAKAFDTVSCPFSHRGIAA